MKPALWFGLVLVYALTACSAFPTRPEPPRVTLSGLKLVSIDLLEQQYRVRLRIKNPNTFALPVRGIDFRLEINGKAFADGVSSQTVDIPAYGESLVELDVTSSLLQVFRQLQSLEESKSPGIEYRISGSVALGEQGRRLPFDNSGEFLLPQSGQTPL